MKIDYHVLSDEIITLLEEFPTITLATCSENHITARTMNFVNDGLNLYFQSETDGVKGQQLRQNPKVAMATRNIQIEGVAHFTTNTEKIDLCSKKFKEKFPDLYERYPDFPEEPTLICESTIFKLYKVIDGKPCHDILNIKDSSAYRHL